ncbi:Family with sequence similarity 96, member A [Nesidiocoris tenuis]|nr:Family with sequence similarity 96, member A [Nesidiocoris tenuis]
MLTSLKEKLKTIVFNDGCESNLPIPPVSTVPDQKLEDENNQFKDIVFNIIRTIKDPEKPSTLEDLNVVYEEGIQVSRNFDNSVYKVLIEITPTVPHCSLATLIGLCIVVKLQKNVPPHLRYKLRVMLKKGTHVSEEDFIKQINDKERVAAAMEVNELKAAVSKCIVEDE